MSEHGSSDHEASIEAEHKADIAVGFAARLLAAAAGPIWRWGDGHGGYVLNRVVAACAHAGLVGPDRTPVAGAMVEFLAGRDGWDCHYCSHPLGWGSPLVRAPQVEHKVPKAAGGGDEAGNLVLSCRPCNERKHTTAHDDFCVRCR